MDDIYGDLENYNDVNAIDELRNDNKQLKIKVAEHEAEIARLQKRVNFLETEYTRISTNFSSLLKTAKAEVERKSQIITTLNQEKDAMVLNSLKNSDKSLLNIRRNLLRNNHINNKKSQNLPKDPETRKSDIERNRIKEETRFTSEDTVTTRCSTDETSNHPADKKADSIHEKLESKENRAQGIRNRRKSMPVSKTTTYTSDEDNGSGKEYKTVRSREDKHRRAERDTKHKVSETSGIDDKYSSHRDSSRETDYKSRRLSDRDMSDRDMRDRYGTHRDNKHDPRRRRESPDRRRPKEYPERPDGRHRVLVSPPGDKHYEHRRAKERQSNRNKPYDRSRSRHDNRPPKHKLPNEEEPVSKRPRTDSFNRLMEEPIPKPKTETNRIMEESISKQFRTDFNMQMEEPVPKPRTEYSIRPSDQQEQLNRLTSQLNKNEMSEQAKDYGQIEKVAEDKKKMSEHKVVNLNLLEDSCLSPDYSIGDVAKNVPREIKLTSSSKLDDPRLKSSKYILITDCEKKTLSTAIGRNVDIKKIDKSTWNTPKVPLPEALRKPPEGNQIVQDDKSKYYDNLVKDVYMDIDNPISNLSVDVSIESGEIHSDTNDTPYARAVAASFFAEYDNASNQTKSDRFTHSKTDKTTFDSKPQRFPENIRNNEVPSVTKSQISSSEKISGTDDNTYVVKKKTDTSRSDANINKHVASYTMPKKSEPTAKTKQYHEDMKQASTKEKIKSTTEKHSPATTSIKETEKSRGKSSQSNKESHNASNSSNSSTLQSTSNESLEANTSKPKIILKLSDLKGYRKLSPRDIVAGDLELSDDTNDFSFTAFSRKGPKGKKIHDNDEKANMNAKDHQSETVGHGDKLNADPIANDKKEKKKSKSHKKHTKTKDLNEADVSKAEQKRADKIAGTNNNTKDDHQSEIYVTNNKTSFGAKTKLNDLYDHPSPILENAEDNTQKTTRKEASTEVVVDKHTNDLSKNPKPNKSDTRKSNEKLKFTELFGDSLSCSLLTPEDLGLNVNTAVPSDNYVPIFEDAQDAVQIDARYHLPKTLKDNNVENLSSKDNMATNTAKEPHSDKTNQISKTSKHEDLDVKAIYENLFPGDEDTKDTEVVKTVILATGSQPTENHNSNSAQTNVIETNSLPNLQEIPLYALATSTPCKPLTLNVLETMQKLPSAHETSHKLAIEQETSQKLSSVRETSQKLATVDEVTEASSITSSNTSSLACSRSSTVDQSSISSMQESEAPVRIILKRRTGKRR